MFPIGTCQLFRSFRMRSIMLAVFKSLQETSKTTTLSATTKQFRRFFDFKVQRILSKGARNGSIFTFIQEILLGYQKVKF